MRRRYALLGMVACWRRPSPCPRSRRLEQPRRRHFRKRQEDLEEGAGEGQAGEPEGQGCEEGCQQRWRCRQTAQARRQRREQRGRERPLSSANAADAKAASAAQSSANVAQATADSKLGTVTTVDSGPAVVFSNSPQSSATATGPSGTSPTGGGGSVGGTAATNGEVVITASGLDGNGWKVTAREITPGTASSWAVFADGSPSCASAHSREGARPFEEP